jgi:hypothetical protein
MHASPFERLPKQFGHAQMDPMFIRSWGVREVGKFPIRPPRADVIEPDQHDFLSTEVIRQVNR